MVIIITVSFLITHIHYFNDFQLAEQQGSFLDQFFNGFFGGGLLDGGRFGSSGSLRNTISDLIRAAQEAAEE